jgi:hypothetical protein
MRWREQSTILPIGTNISTDHPKSGEQPDSAKTQAEPIGGKTPFSAARVAPINPPMKRRTKAANDAKNQ